MEGNRTNCSLGESLLAIEKQLSFAAYTVVTPIYFIIGILSRGLCLVAFYKQSKHDKAYGYQGFAALSELFEVITVALCMATRNNFAGYRLPGATWFQKSYALMWYAAHLASPLEQGMITTSLLISLSMAADRTFAMAKPFLYKNINHRRHQLIAATISFTLGLSTSAFDAFRYQLRYDGIKYEMTVKEEYVATQGAFALAIFRNVVRILANLALVLCNILMIVYYRLKAHKVRAMDGNEERMAKRKSTHRTLVMLTLCQSVFTTSDLTMFNVYYSLVYMDSRFTSCFGKVMAPMDDLVLQITGVLEVFVLLSISRNFRAIISSVLCCKGKHAGGAHVDHSPAPGHGQKT